MSESFNAAERAERERPRLDTVRGAGTGPGRERPLGAARKPTKRQRSWFPWSRSDVPVLITQLDPTSIGAEAYRTVRTNLEFIRTDRPFRNVAVTSPTAGSGKSTTAANLSVAAAQSGLRVCLVDADLRRPVLHEVFGLSNTGGLTTSLRNGVSLNGVARATAVENLSLVVSGQNGDGLAQHLFTTQRVQKILSEAGSDFDLVVYDTPPILSVADAVTIAALCDGVILVVKSGSIPFTVLQRAVQQIDQVNGRILGVLLNQVNLRGGDDDAYRYYRAYYGEKPRK
jgi:capsular exopolysaccharide synthesis family protein